MTFDFTKTESMATEILKSAKIFDFFSIQEKQRFSELLHSSMVEFEEMHPFNSYSDKISAQNDAKLYLIEQISASEDIFGIKDFSKKINVDDFLKEYFNQEFLSE